MTVSKMLLVRSKMSFDLKIEERGYFYNRMDGTVSLNYMLLQEMLEFESAVSALSGQPVERTMLFTSLLLL